MSLLEKGEANPVANGLQNNMPKFYCDYCDTNLTHDSPSMRKTHCSGRRHKENVKDYYQKWMEEQAQSLIDKTSASQSPSPVFHGSSSSWVIDRGILMCWMTEVKVIGFPGIREHINIHY